MPRIDKQRSPTQTLRQVPWLTGSGDLMAGGEVVKAGDIMFAVLETSINTDEKDTPVMARIVGGPYKGGKLIGRFSLADKRVFLTFNLLNLPDHGKSVAINQWRSTLIPRARRFLEK